jgi:hypothetical protein
MLAFSAVKPLYLLSCRPQLKEIAMSPETMSHEVVLENGKMICSGHVPFTYPGIYMEVWEYEGYCYAITNTLQETRCHPLGTSYNN